VQQDLDQRAVAQKHLETFGNFVKANIPKTEKEIRSLEPAKAQSLVTQLRALAAPVIQDRNTGLYDKSPLRGKTVPLSSRFPNIHVNAAIPVVPIKTKEAAQADAASLPIGRPLALSGINANPNSLSGVDADLDGLDDGFEADLADAFKFTYKVSNNEQAGTEFASFYDFVPQTVQQTFGTTPHLYYRVKPLGYTTGSDGNYYNLIQIDYLTTWNRDDGLVTGTGCTVAYGIFFGLAGVAVSYVLDGLESHALDNERTAHLLASQTTTPGVYSTNVYDWHGIAAYTAAHEGTANDSSQIISFAGVGDALPYSPKLTISLSKSKHASYGFNPDGLTLVPGWVQAAAAVAIQFISDPYEYLIAVGAYETTCYVCITEKFDDPGFAQPPSFFVNVGEPNKLINGSTWILDNGPYSYYPKLNGYILWPLL
jgi:hypothetical protein